MRSPRPAASLSSMERGRPSHRTRTGHTGAPSSDSRTADPRLDHLTEMMQTMLTRIDRLDEERFSRRSSSSHRTVGSWGGFGVGFPGRGSGPGLGRQDSLVSPPVRAPAEDWCIPNPARSCMPSLAHPFVPEGSTPVRYSLAQSGSGFAQVSQGQPSAEPGLVLPRCYQVRIWDS